MPIKHAVRLSPEDRTTLVERTTSGSAPARTITRARILLKADESTDGAAWTDQQIADALDVGLATVARTRKRALSVGPIAATEHKRPDREYVRALDGAAEARLTQIACSAPPDGYARWSLRLLAGQMVELGHVPALSRETVRRALKKNALKPWLSEQWVIPPDEDAAFVAQMEDVLAVYHRASPEGTALVCLDETSKQLLAETRTPVPCAPGQAARYDYEYERRGVVSLFMVFDPVRAWREVTVRERRTAVDFAHVVRDLLTGPYAGFERVVLVMDNLNTHTSLYKAFPAVEARALAERLEIHFTPKHGSWLNMAEIELSVLGRQCLSRRVETAEVLRSEAAAWSSAAQTLPRRRCRGASRSRTRG